ncbi:hypothetical protein HFO58_31930 [Rhizobium leguminosarum]|uniref:hypothetical protein n=1 Tax=Rhizobium leguminosarum TaxID=384 RepID=UPI001C942AAE|nr:hypothetical protein [Rhizobium leguminosarum]MBY5537703.1 hypothetical protein [Rhizobium leguminosarum]
MHSIISEKYRPVSGSSVAQLAPVKAPMRPAPLSTSFGPSGIDPHHWSFALLLQVCIGHLERKKLLGRHGLPKTPECAESLHRCWIEARLQVQKKWSTPQEVAYFRPLSIAQFNRYVKRYRECGNHPLALVPHNQWRKPIADWDDHVYAITILQSVELCHPTAKLRQQSLSFAAAFIAKVPQGENVKAAKVFKAYRAAVADANDGAGGTGGLPLIAIARHMFNCLPTWFPQLIEKAGMR